jgi:hypothetical protein
MEASPQSEDVEFDEVASEVDDRQSSPAAYEIATYPADFTLEGIEKQWQAEELIIPRFQRGFVWSQAQASKLIESFLVGLPVPGIFLYTERHSGKYLVVDGQQRLRSIFYYFEGFFGEERDDANRTVFRLTGLAESSPYLGKSYEDLLDSDEEAARRFRNSVLRAFVVRQLDPQDDTSVFHIFERLNTGGTLAVGQEVRNAVYSGPFNQLLMELNELDDWRAVVGKSEPDKRMRDVELILRFFSLRYALESYEKPMKDFLSHYMRTHARADEEQIEAYRQDFTNTVAAVHEHLGERPFHLRAGLNASAYDCVFSAFSKNLGSIPNDINERYEALTGSEEFEDLVRSGTTDVGTVRQRMSLAEEQLFG